MLPRMSRESSARTMKRTMRGTVALVLVSMLAMVLVSEANVRGSGPLNSELLFQHLSAAYVYQSPAKIDFVASSVPVALTDYQNGLIDFFISDVPLGQDRLGPFDGIQIPMMGTPLVMAYNLEPYLAANETVVMDGLTMALCWTGNISKWNDYRIKELNPDFADKLPDLNITLSYWNPSKTALGFTAVFKEALGVFSEYAAALLAANGNELEKLPPMLEGRGVTGDPFEVGQWRIDYVKAHPGCMGYMERNAADAIDLKYIHMINRAGNTVEGSPAAVQAAMDDFREQIHGGQLVLSILDAPGPDSWPMSFVSYLTLSRNRTGRSQLDCSRVRDLLLFLSWVETNDGVDALFESVAFAPLTNPYKRRLIDEMYKITCDGKPALTTPVLIGMGEPLFVFTAWADAFSSTSFSMKYFQSTSNNTKQELSFRDVDYAVAGSALSPQQQQMVPDARGLPAIAYALVPAYNLAGLTQPLALDMETIAAIYLGHLTRWDDARIRALNPNVALPNTTIVPILECGGSSDVLAAFTKALARNVPAFAAAVQPGPDAVLPVRSDPRAVCADDTPAALSSTANSFAIWPAPQLSIDARDVKQAALRNPSGNLITASDATLAAAVAADPDRANDPDGSLVLSPGEGIWPMAAYQSLLIQTRNMTDCNKAAALADWIYWTQTAPEASSLANTYAVVVASEASEPLRRRTMLFLDDMMCGERYVSNVHGCVTSEGLLCSDHGSCSAGVCSCDEGWEGSMCEKKESGTSDATVLAASLGAAIPVGGFILCLLLAMIVMALLLVRRRDGRHLDEFTIDFDELEVGDQLGRGGYGAVHKAQWKGDQVAVKLMAPEAITKDATRNFVSEVEIMSRLRHPNVVLFMAASIKPPRLCIVMELMALGSLFDLIHNDLVPELPFVLKVKLLHQAAKGMHFLHSSGIVHRDLKSLNLLLDAKWNLKVADFGLTKFKSALKVNREDMPTGTVPWMAPEVLGDEEDTDYMLADVYSFGVIMWEVMTRKQPYQGMSPAQIAVAVIRNDMRPPISRNEADETERGYAELMIRCWNRDPTMRDTFDKIMKELEQLKQDAGGGTGTGTGFSTTLTSTSGTSSNTLGLGTGPRDSATRSGASTTSSGDDAGLGRGPRGMVDRRRVPRRNVSYAVCDLADMDGVWRTDPSMADQLIADYGLLVRKHCVAQRAHLFSHAHLHSGGTFLLAFEQPRQAATFALGLAADAARQPHLGEMSRVSLHHRPGTNMAKPDDHTGTTYEKDCYEEACRLNTLCPPGSVLCSSAFRSACTGQAASDGGNALPDSARLLSIDNAGPALLVSSSVEEEDEDLLRQLEDLQPGSPLCSSNACQWIIDRNSVHMMESIGEGNYGQVWEASYQGRLVAVKRLFASRLDDEATRRMRKEAAILFDLQHPNMVKLIGLSIWDGNLALVMELVPGCNLRKMLSGGRKLGWSERIRLLRDAALGIDYLHSRDVIHRDIKSSNLLVDSENNSVKVADFGFATIKQENATMTRCGTPAWTAPEVLDPSRLALVAAGDDTKPTYTEKADVYSFGIVMWEVLTGKEPYAEGGHNLMRIVEEVVVNHKRPAIPSDCPPDFSSLMQRCWHRKPRKRPDMSEVVVELNRMLHVATGGSSADV